MRWVHRLSKKDDSRRTHKATHEAVPGTLRVPRLLSGLSPGFFSGKTLKFVHQWVLRHCFLELVVEWIL